MIALISLILYFAVVLVIMYYSTMEVAQGTMAVVETIVMVVLVSGIPALLGVLNGINYEKKFGGSKAD